MGGRPPHTIQDMQRLAQQRDGQCLSTRYVNTRTKLRWQCAHGHIWESTPSNVLRGRWCRTCVGFPPHSLDEMHQLARDRSGQCLSTRYVDTQTKLRWQCARGHTWESTPKNILRGRWCGVCAGNNPYTLDKMYQLAQDHGGQCLSTRYVNTRTKLRWQCARGHVWEGLPDSILRGHWCRVCVGKDPYTLRDMRRLARQRGGQCLSTWYVNRRTKLQWQCQQGHTWESAPYNIVRGHWCRICAGFSPHSLDEMHQLARDRGGKCLSKAYIDTTHKLRWQCAQGHRWAAEPGLILQGHWCPACNMSPKETLANMQKLARRRKGKCLSRTYVNRTTKLLWECAEGHQWETTPKLVKQGRWCPACALARLKGATHPRYTITDMQHLAAARGGVCLSEFYRNKDSKLRWQCAHGHVWETVPRVIRGGSWCPECARLKQMKKPWLAPAQRA